MMDAYTDGQSLSKILEKLYKIYKNLLYFFSPVLWHLRPLYAVEQMNEQ